MTNLTIGQQLYRRRLEIRDRPESYLNDYGEVVEVVPERLLRARIEACWSLEELADQVPCSHAYLWEAEETGQIGRRALALVADLCDQPREYFFRPWPPDRYPQIQGLADWVREIRESAQASLSQWQEQTGIHESTWNKWENGAKSPRGSSLRRIREIEPDAPWPPDGRP